MNKIKSTSIILAVVIALFGGAALALQANVSAASHTVSSGQSIQAALKAAAPGDTVTVNAGTYNEQLEITKPVTLKGNGAVVVNTKASTNVNPTDSSHYNFYESFKGVAIYDTTNVTIEGITFDGENAGTGATRQTGIDISGMVNTTLTNVTVKNYVKNGIAVTTQFDAGRPIGKDVAFNNVTVDNAAWAGIAFYTKSTTVDVALRGITFSGVTTVANTAYGIQFGDASSTQPIEGVNGGPVALGTVAFANNTANISQDVPSLTSITLENDSTVDGVPVTAADFDGLSVTLVEPAVAVIPGVPNTAIAE